MKKTHILLLTFLFLSICQLKAQNITIKGQVIDETGAGMSQMLVSITQSGKEAFTDSLGYFQIMAPEGKKATLKCSAFGFETEYKTIRPYTGASNTVTINMRSLNFVLDAVEVKDKRTRMEAGSLTLNTDNIGIRPDPAGGVEGMLKMLVGSRNELSSQYSVRGGNFDENLVYINGFQVYRPFLVRSGQQEGLSIVNADLVGKIDFSTGGFQAKHGDKMSSVLDISYKRPKKFAGSAMASLLGLQGHIEGRSENKKLNYLVGVRQKSNQYFLQSQPTKGQYTPNFIDAQFLVNYQLSSKVKLELLGNYARNRFSFQPDSVVENFGYVNQAYRFKALYEGFEVDQFDASFVGLSLSHQVNPRLNLKYFISSFQTNEKETYDLAKSFLLTSIETDLGKDVGSDQYSLGSGTIMNHARNYLQANVVNAYHRGSYDANRHFLQWGIDMDYTQVSDQLDEWEYRDSAGFSQPHNPNFAEMYSVYKADNQLKYNRFHAFIQDNIILNHDRTMTLNIGTRLNYSTLNKELIISPRLQFSLKPDWTRDIVFRFATGIYAQPAFYREMRDFNGPLNTNQKAQKAFHIAGGFDYNFTAWGDRPFKLTGELFYKNLWDLVPYQYDNVRIRYFPNNTAKGYAYGGELRLFGDLVKNAESWVSVGYLKTQNKIRLANGTYTDYIARPTDQRMTFGLYFSDYLPRNKNFKVFMNLMYATGLPFTAPGRQFEPGQQIRIPDYKRVDIGFATLLLDGKRNTRPYYSLFSKIDDVWLSLEVFNLLGNLNTLSYSWLRPANSTAIFAIPNRLTNRLINLKLAFRF